MAINDYVNVAISATGPGPSAPGFGTGLLAAYHTVGGSKHVLGPYTSASGVLADMSNVSIGGNANAATQHTYKAALKYFAQTPQPQLLYIGRRADVYTQLVTITPVSLVNGTTYLFVIGGVNGVGGVTVSYTVSGSPTLATVCTAIAALLNTATVGAGPVAGFVADGSSGTHVLCTTATAGKLVEYQCQVPAGICRITESTLNPTAAGGIAADLAAIWAENKNWYGLGIDSPGKQEGEAASQWVEANGSVICALSTSDSDAADSTVTTDLLSFLETNSVTRTAGLFTQYSNLSFGGFGWLATRLTQTPGSDTWNFNTIALVQADSDYLVPESSILAVKAKNGTVYTTLAGLNLTQGGTSGGGEWMDQTRFIDWLRVTIQLAMIALLARNVGKIPYDDTGIATIEQTIKQVLEQGVKNGGFVKDSYVVTPPSVAGIPTANKTARNLPSLPWTAKFAGAIHTMTINGTTSVA